jgi:hypothetical protein
MKTGIMLTQKGVLGQVISQIHFSKISVPLMSLAKGQKNGTLEL